MKKYFVIAIFLMTGISFAQKLNSYKYAIVPEKFTFLKQKNQYNLNELLKFGMQKYGFVTFYESDILPDDINNDNKVYVDVLENNSMFSTKVTIVLKDFKNNILFTSNEGKSLDKSLEIAYNVALRDAINILSSLKHVYTNNIKVTNLKETNVVYQAKPITNGYELLFNDVVIYKMLKTSNKDFYKSNKGDLQGTMFLKDNQYYFEYYSNDVLITEKITIKF